MPESPEDNLRLSAKGVNHSVVLSDEECFEPMLPRAFVPPAPKLGPKPKSRSFTLLIDKICRQGGSIPTPTPTPPESELSASAPAVATGDGEMPRPTEIPSAPVDAQLPPPRAATATELFTWIKRALLAQTNLSNDAAELVAFWTISTWHQEAFTVLPCLVITGPAHDASRVLHVLSDFCLLPALLPGFARSHLKVLRCRRTNLILDPNLDTRTANLLSSLTDKKSLVVTGPSLACYSKSAAIYAGENPETYKIQNSIHIHLTPTNAEPTACPPWLQTMIERVPIHLKQYRDKNLGQVLHSPWSTSGLSSEMMSVATELGRCIVDAPELRLKLVALLKTQDKQRLSHMSNTTEAVVLEAIINLCHGGNPKFLVGEIATEVNRIQKARGERLTYSPETVGRLLNKIGLTTRRLGAAGKGLVMNRATIARAHELAAMYGGVGLDRGENNLHCPFCTENKRLM
jgi:hypothetical protein